MSDKLNRKIIKEYAQLRKDYTKLVIGLDVSISKYEQATLSALSVNELTIDNIMEDMVSLKKEIELINFLPAFEVKKNKLKK